MVVLFTVCLIFVVYVVGLVFARRADNRDKMKVGFLSRSAIFFFTFSYNSSKFVVVSVYFTAGPQDPFKGLSSKTRLSSISDITISSDTLAYSIPSFR